MKTFPSDKRFTVLVFPQSVWMGKPTIAIQTMLDHFLQKKEEPWHRVEYGKSNNKSGNQGTT